MNTNRRRCLRIGRALIKGPTAIFPPKFIDSFGWLEADFRLTIKWPGPGLHESLQVFSDDTMNRDKDFLPPMIRRCIWKRAADMANPNAWPSATVEIGYIQDHKRRDALLRDVHRKLPGLPFVELGLSTQRDVADLELDESEPEFRIWARNGVQSLEYWSSPVAPAHLGLSFTQVHKDLLAEFLPISQPGWRERYDHDLNEEPRQGWELDLT
ncbi:hypothetical protein [Pseudoduganella violaceinigra]|uniref:hypothetical protein n=1 Tax=Pseudoduganella violaceinigra TaxID=246602 RepID=UPI0012B630E2|nr:hypothetical protein [Pseudoduganella violaceinigra]